MIKVDQIIHAKWVITCDEPNQILENHCLTLKDGKILAMLPSKDVNDQYQAPLTKRYETHAILPGFINCHTHIAMNLFRGLADDLDLMDWLNNHIWPAEKKWVSPEMVYDGSMLAIAEMIRSGTICFNDMFYFMDKTAEAAELAGIRAHIGMTIIDFPTAFAKTSEEYFEKSIEFYQRYKNHAKITPTLAPHSTYMVSIDNLLKIKKLNEDLNLKINIHLQEDAAEIKQVEAKYQKRPLQILNDLGLLSQKIIAIHMTQVNEKDFSLLKDNKPGIVHCPESNMKLANGTCPVEFFKAMGLNVALGTDGAASNNDLDMLGEMRSAAFLGKLATNNPKALSAETALKMATIDGAKVLGIDHITGSLKAGKAADFIAINFNCIETEPLYNPISQIVYAASRHQVTDVWVGGQQLLKNRELQTLDENEILKKAQIWRERIRS